MILLPFIMALSGRLHGWAGFNGCKWIARVIIGSAYSYPVYIIHGIMPALLIFAMAIIAFAATHGRWFQRPLLFAAKGFAIALPCSVLTLNPYPVLFSTFGWGFAYWFAKRNVGYDHWQEGKFWAPGIWSFHGEWGSLFIAGLGLLV